MFDKSKIQTALSGLVGWQQPLNPDYDIIDSANQISRSNRFVTENPFCKIEFIKDNSDYKNQSDANFNTGLVNLMNTAISNVCDNVFDSNDYIDRSVIYRNPNNKVNIETLPNGFVGYEIDMTTKSNVAVKISRVVSEFSNTGLYTLLLYSSQKASPIQTKSITVNSTSVETILNWVIDNTGTLIGGKWYIGYIAGSLIPYKRDYESSNIISEIKDVCIKSMYSEGVETNELWDLRNNQYADQCWGLNFDVTVYNDYTDLIINNEMLFAKAIQLQAQINVIEMCRASLRSNFNERISRDMIIEVEGIDVEDGIKKVGLKNLLAGQLKDIKKEIQRLRTNYKPLGLQVYSVW